MTYLHVDIIAYIRLEMFKVLF